MSAIKLTFLGTRGNTMVCSATHRRHSSLLVGCGGLRVMIDCGADWLDELGVISPDAIVLTHAHPDHASGLGHGAPCPVYATVETWHLLGRMPVTLRQAVLPKKPFAIGTLEFEAFAVVHSPVAPAVGYRIRGGNASLCYVPDVLEIPDHRKILGGIDLFIGDGARLNHPLRRGEGDRVSGHASIRQQLSWCADASVRRAIFTHCGTPTITADDKQAEATVEALGEEFGIAASLASDGLEIAWAGRCKEPMIARRPKSRGLLVI